MFVLRFFFFMYSVVYNQAIPLLVSLAFFESLFPCWLIYFPQNLLCFTVCSFILHCGFSILLCVNLLKEWNLLMCHSSCWVDQDFLPEKHHVMFIFCFVGTTVIDFARAFHLTFQPSEQPDKYVELDDATTYDSDQSDPFRSDSEDDSVPKKRDPATSSARFAGSTKSDPDAKILHSTATTVWHKKNLIDTKNEDIPNEDRGKTSVWGSQYPSEQSRQDNLQLRKGDFILHKGKRGKILAEPAGREGMYLVSVGSKYLNVHKDEMEKQEFRLKVSRASSGELVRQPVKPQKRKSDNHLVPF